jgi:hypothetical protein
MRFLVKEATLKKRTKIKIRATIIPLKHRQITHKFTRINQSIRIREKKTFHHKSLKGLSQISTIRNPQGEILQ